MITLPIAGDLEAQSHDQKKSAKHTGKINSTTAHRIGEVVKPSTYWRDKHLKYHSGLNAKVHPRLLLFEGQ